MEGVFEGRVVEYFTRPVAGGSLEIVVSLAWEFYFGVTWLDTCRHPLGRLALRCFLHYFLSLLTFCVKR